MALSKVMQLATGIFSKSSDSRSDTVAPAKSGFLRVNGTSIVDKDGEEFILKGAAIGGHLNMENFITGYTGHEHELRAAMLDVLGKEKYDFFFEKFLEYFFTAEDAKLFASLGLNQLRIPFNYRHFIDDQNPEVINPQGFALLDRIVNLCANEGIYTILDLHATPGGHNQDWHSDSGIHKALFWEFKTFQDQMVNLWVEIAKHYRDNTWVAGYNPLNEPADPKHTRLLNFYDRVESAIRAVDPNHMLFLDGNTYAMDFSAFKNTLPNTVYSIHDYSFMGFPLGESYEGTKEQDESLRRQYERKVEFMKENKVPIWNGEFGPVYANPSDGPDYEETNQKRYALLGAQMAIYRQDRISWSIWLYKDIGYQGMTYVNQDSAYLKLLAPFLAKKKRLALDFWGRDDAHVKQYYEPLYQHVEQEMPNLLQRSRYPHIWDLRRHFDRVIKEMLFSEYMVKEFAECFRDKSLEELDELAASFKLENCIQRKGLNKILQAQNW